MAFSLALLVMVGLLSDATLKKINLPGLVGMLVAGIIVGPYCLDLMAPAMMLVSEDFRMIALIVILLRAGLELRRDTLHRVGGAALTMSAVPAIFEMAAITLLAPPLLGLGTLEAAILGSILSAVSPAVVVPLMIDFMERGKGAKKGIPTLILAASSVDDVFVIVIFTILMGMAGGESVNWLFQLGSIPISIILGIIAGLIPGYLLHKLFARFDLKPPRRTLILIGAAIALTEFEHSLKGVIPVASLLGVMAIGFILLEKEEAIAHLISSKMKKLWVFAELLLFVLVGAQVNIEVAWNAGLAGTLLITGGLVARSIGTYVSLIFTDLTHREKMFAVVSYLPKATVQAAIGAAPLAAGIEGGEVILAVAVLSILITAPLGAIAIRSLGEKVLEVSLKPEYRFKDLREKLGLARVGQRLREKSSGDIWKVIEEQETWVDAPEPGDKPYPRIVQRFWRQRAGQAPGTGLTRIMDFDNRDEPLDYYWEIMYDY